MLTFEQNLAIKIHQEECTNCSEGTCSWGYEADVLGDDRWDGWTHMLYWNRAHRYLGRMKQLISLSENLSKEIT